MKIGDRVQITWDKSKLKKLGAYEEIAGCFANVIHPWNSRLQLDRPTNLSGNLHYIEVDATLPEHPDVSILEGWFPEDTLYKTDKDKVLGENWESVSRSWQQKLWDRLR